MNMEAPAVAVNLLNIVNAPDNVADLPLTVLIEDS